MASRDVTHLYCFLLRAGDCMVVRSKAPWIQAIRQNFGMPNADVTIFDASEWRAPTMVAMHPSSLERQLHSLETGVAVMSAMKEALAAHGVLVASEALYADTLVETSPTKIFADMESIESSWASLVFCPSLSKAALLSRRRDKA